MHSDLSPQTPAILYGEGDRIQLLRKMLKTLGQPDQKFKIIHLAGTNGKGSTSTIIAAILAAQNLRTGLFTSPHLFTERESVQVDGIMIEAEAFQSSLSQVHQAAISINLKPEEDLSQFETTFLLAMLYFAEQACDYVVLETGLGGLLDATNAITRSDYAIFTKIGLDHLDFLGDNLATIVETKAGIMRSDQTVVVGPFQKEGVENQLQTLAHESGADLISADLSLVKALEAGAYEVSLAQQPAFEVTLGLKGAFQGENLTTAMTWLNHWLQAEQRSLDVAQLQAALESLSLPGRFETVPAQPPVILDGAHNVDAIQEFVKSVEELYTHQKVTVICAFLKDKDVTDMVEKLSQLKADFILTQADHPERYLAVEELATIFTAQGIQAPSFEEPLQALKYAQETLSQPIFIVGSFYLIKAIRKEFDLHA